MANNRERRDGCSKGAKRLILFQKSKVTLMSSNAFSPIGSRPCLNNYFLISLNEGRTFISTNLKTVFFSNTKTFV